MTANGYTKEDILENGATMSFPESIKEMMRGDLGQPQGGFPKKVQKIILKKEKPFTERPNAHLELVDWEKEWKSFKAAFKNGNELDLISYLLYPKVFTDFYNIVQEFGDVSILPTQIFFYGIQPNEEIMIDIAEGKTLIVKLRSISQADEDGMKTVTFDMNGQIRRVRVLDKSLKITKVSNQKASATEDGEVGSPLQGKIAEVLVKEGDTVKAGDSLFVIEAMKMETTVSTPKAGKVKKIVLGGGSMVEQDDLVIVVE